MKSMNRLVNLTKVYLLCASIEKEKCPPWTLQATKMIHDNKKTIYYDNAV